MDLVRDAVEKELKGGRNSEVSIKSVSRRTSLALGVSLGVVFDSDRKGGGREEVYRVRQPENWECACCVRLHRSCAKRISRNCRGRKKV
jgi:hypothetical protein